MVRDDVYEFNTVNAETGTVCSYDLHPDLWYDIGTIMLDIKNIKNIEEGTIIRISKDNKYDPKKGLIA